MKVLSILSLSLLIPSLAIAQPFEGTVTYSVAMENPLPGLAGQMMAKLLPTKMLYNFDETGAVRFNMDGPSASDVIIPAEGKPVYYIMEEKKKVLVMDEKEMEKQMQETRQGKPVVTKTDETADILGYTCQRYNISIPNKKGETKQSIWVTEKIKPQRPKYDTQNMFSADIDGMPLKVVTDVNGSNMVMQATEVKAQSLDASLFRKPEGYTEEPFSAKAARKK